MAFSLQAVFGIDATGVKTEIKQLRKELNSFVQDYAKLGAGIAVGAFIALSKGALDLAASLKDTSQQVGINVESLQALHYAATQNGSSVESMNKALEKLRLNTQAAVEGNKQYSDALATLGLNAQQVAAVPLEKKYALIATAVKNSTDKAAAYNAVSELFGSKIGPDQIAVLHALATDGFPKTAQAAAAAGQVMSAETIVALEKASQAIDDFKKRATIAVGDILVNFRSEEGLKLLGLQLLRAAASFGGKIVDAISEANDIMGALFKGTFTGAANWLRDKLIDGLQAYARVLNKILPDKFEINIAGLDQFRSSGEYVSASISRAIAETKPSTFQKDFTAYWDKAIASQKTIVDQLNKVDFGPEAKKLTDAGKNLAKSMDQPAATLASASEHLKKSGLTLGEAMTNGAFAWEETMILWKDNIKNSIEVAKQMGGLLAGIRGGSTFNDLSDDALKEVVRQNRAQAGALRNPALNPYAGGIGASLDAGRLEAEALNAQSQLDVRNRFRGAIDNRGIDAARREFDPVVFEQLLRDFGPGSQDVQNKQLTALEKLNDRLKQGVPLVLFNGGN